LFKEPATSQVDEATRTLYQLGRSIWRGHGGNTLPYITTCLCVTVGDLQRETRKLYESKRPNMPVVGTELGNLVLSSIRWLDDLDLDPVHCIRVAAGTQRRYANEH
jgi:hypothetical protein